MAESWLSARSPHNMNDNILYHALALRSGQMKRFPRTRGDRPEIVAAYNEPPRVPPHARG